MIKMSSLSCLAGRQARKRTNHQFKNKRHDQKLYQNSLEKFMEKQDVFHDQHH